MTPDLQLRVTFISPFLICKQRQRQVALLPLVVVPTPTVKISFKPTTHPNANSANYSKTTDHYCAIKITAYFTNLAN